MMKRQLLLPVFTLLLGILAFAEGTDTWTQSKYDEFESGTAHGVSIRSDGVLELAPTFKSLSTTPSTYVWAIVSDSAGNVYAAAGSPARVYRITPQGQLSIVFQPEELQVQSLLIDNDGTLFVATSPDGKVYKITHAGERNSRSEPAQQSATPSQTGSQEKPAELSKVPVDSSWKPSVLFDPKTKYIWALAEDNEGRIYVATGDQGEIFRVDKTGAGSLFFKSDEAHIRALAVDGKGNVIAGSDGSGLIYRITPSGDGFVLYSARKKEITALAVDSAGNIYAAGTGEKKGEASAAPISPLPGASTITITSAVPGATQSLTATPNPASPTSPGTPTVGGSDVYRIAPDGSPKRLWTSHDDIVYALAFDQRSRLLAGTGNKGRVFVIGDGTYTDMGDASANQVTSIAKAPNGGLYLGTSNLGKIFMLAGSADSEGSFESDVFDARIFSRWGRLQVRSTGNVDIFARSGNVDNPDRNWSAWRKVDVGKEASADVPPARFVQWKAVLHPGNPAATVDSVTVNYLSKNVPPEVDEVHVQVGAKFASGGRSSDAGSISVAAPTASSSRFDSGSGAVRDRESIAVRWIAHDDNEDDLVYSVYYRGDNETRWKLLKDDIEEKRYSFDAGLLPDGGYVIRVVASDGPSHSPEEALTGYKDSERFEVDTTPPQVTNLNGAVEGNTIRLTFRAVDGYSPIDRAEYSVDAGDWHAAEPVGQISDYRVENYDLTVPLPMTDTTVGADEPVSSGKTKKSAVAANTQEHVVVVRVWDRFDNQGSAKTLVRGR